MLRQYTPKTPSLQSLKGALVEWEVLGTSELRMERRPDQALLPGRKKPPREVGSVQCILGGSCRVTGG